MYNPNVIVELNQVNLDNDDVNNLICTLASSPKYETYWCQSGGVNDNQVHFPYKSIMPDDFSCYSTSISTPSQGVLPFGPMICGRSGHEIAEVLDHNRFGYASRSSNTALPSSNTAPPSSNTDSVIVAYDSSLQ